MSRSTRHRGGSKGHNNRGSGKGPGWEVWSTRYDKAVGLGPGKYAKKLTNRATRRKARRSKDDDNST